ncbi:hypothetical protein AVEN_115649-1 [Araneus ventricosus]|uniref:Uncharacterized protein n=1 Tax=Araneus ventricosus TaxID=182803 RepID=A0A4Y2KZ24_ARAVE|nr:hypothetical protein AVEN_115649-1 [Araneus ventricosus]
MAIQNSNLPPSLVNEIVEIVEDETVVRSNLKSVSDVYSWIEEYGRTSDTKWNLRSSRPSGTKLVCWHKFACHHSEFHKVPKSQNKRGISKNSNCPTTITIKVKLDTQNVKKKDEYAKVC